MTIILDMGTWWVEVHQTSATMPAGTGAFDSTQIFYDRRGSILISLWVGRSGANVDDKESLSGHIDQFTGDGVAATLPPDVGQNADRIILRFFTGVASTGGILNGYLFTIMRKAS